MQGEVQKAEGKSEPSRASTSRWLSPRRMLSGYKTSVGKEVKSTPAQQPKPLQEANRDVTQNQPVQSEAEVGEGDRDFPLNKTPGVDGHLPPSSTKEGHGNIMARLPSPRRMLQKGLKTPSMKGAKMLSSALRLPSPRSHRDAADKQVAPPQPSNPPPHEEVVDAGAPEGDAEGRVPQKYASLHAGALTPGLLSGCHEQAGSARQGAHQLTEPQMLARQMLSSLYHQDISVEVVLNTLQEYPHVAWVAQCAARCPQPPYWVKVEDVEGPGSCIFANSQTGETSPCHPLHQQFTYLAGLVLKGLRGRNPDVSLKLRAMLEQSHADTQLTRTVWNGPHLDPSSGAEYWFNTESGTSTWGDPAVASEFLARVISALIDVFAALQPAPQESAPPPSQPPAEAAVKPAVLKGAAAVHGTPRATVPQSLGHQTAPSETLLDFPRKPMEVFEVFEDAPAAPSSPVHAPLQDAPAAPSSPSSRHTVVSSMVFEPPARPLERLEDSSTGTSNDVSGLEVEPSTSGFIDAPKPLEIDVAASSTCRPDASAVPVDCEVEDCVVDADSVPSNAASVAPGVRAAEELPPTRVTDAGRPDVKNCHGVPRLKLEVCHEEQPLVTNEALSPSSSGESSERSAPGSPSTAAPGPVSTAIAATRHLVPAGLPPPPLSGASQTPRASVSVLADGGSIKNWATVISTPRGSAEEFAIATPRSVIGTGNA